MSKVVDLVRPLITSIVEELQLELVDIEYVKEGKDWFLRVFIDQEQGIGIEECSLVSERLSVELDQKDPIKDPYILEVSSPGAERPLKKKQDFENAIGRNIHVKLFEAINGEKEYEGVLLLFDGEQLVMEIKVRSAKREVTIPFSKIAKARLAVTF